MVKQQVLATVSASAPRRLFGLATVSLLGGLVLYLAFKAPPQSLPLQLFLILLGLGCLGLAMRMQRVTQLVLDLTETELRDSSGTVLAEIAQIDRVERGAFAFKPSNGFILHLTTAQSRAWSPGLWWRLGRRVGVGGVAPGAQTKIMAETIQAMISARQAAAKSD